MSHITVILGHTRSRKLLARMRANGWGRCVIADPITPYPREPWILDNGAFSFWRNGRAYDWSRFRRKLSELVGGDPARLPLFAVAPDLPAEGTDSLLFSLDWLHRLNEELIDDDAAIGAERLTLFGLLDWYLAVQDGQEPAHLDDDCDECGERIIEHFSGLFLGGTVEWKERTAQVWSDVAHAAGLKFHYARCGTVRKLEHAVAVGADSVDSAMPLFTQQKFDAFERAWLRLSGPRQFEILPEAYEYVSRLNWRENA